MTGPLVHGILLEGMCFSGKTTVAQALVEVLSEIAPVRFNHCYLNDNVPNRLLHDLAIESIGSPTELHFPDREILRCFNAYRSANIMIDAAALSVEPGEFTGIRVQDRHWFSQLCHNDFFNPEEGYLSPHWIRSCAPVFTVNVYLASDTSMRKARSSAGARSGENAIHEYFRNNMNELEKFELFCREKCNSLPDWHVLDSNALGLAQTLDTIVKTFREAAIQRTFCTGYR